MENDGSQVPELLSQIKEYTINLEKKYSIITAVMVDALDIDEDSSLGEAIKSIYSKVGKEVPEEFQDLLEKPE